MDQNQSQPINLKCDLADMLKTNIYSLYVIKIAKWFNLVMPTIVLFYQSAGMGMQDILLLKSIYSVAIVVFEIPSGYAADLWGRKKTLVVGSVFGALGFLIYSVNTLYAGFVVAEILLGLGHSFISGSDTAMLFDTLKASDRTDHYLKQEGRVTALGNFAEAIAGVVGGLLAAVSLRTPFYFQVAVAAAAIPAAICLKEPAFHTGTPGDRQTLGRLFQTVRYTVLSNRKLKAALLISSFTGTATLTFAWFVQPFFKAVEVPIPLYGLLWTLLNLTVGAMGLCVHRYRDLFGFRIGLALAVGGVAGGYFLAGTFVTLYGLGTLLFFYMARGIISPLLKDYIHQHCESSVRATVLSLRNFTIRIVFALIGPLLGWMADQNSLQSALCLTGGVYLAAVGACAAWLWYGERFSRPALKELSGGL